MRQGGSSLPAATPRNRPSWAARQAAASSSCTLMVPGGARRVMEVAAAPRAAGVTMLAGASTRDLARCGDGGRGGGISQHSLSR